jgi:hypothetical protein
MGLGGTPARKMHDNRQPRPRRCQDHRSLWKRRPETGVVFLRKRKVRSCLDGAMPGDRFRTGNSWLCRLSLDWSGPPAISRISKQHSIVCAALRGSASRLFSEQKLGYEPEPS